MKKILLLVLCGLLCVVNVQAVPNQQMDIKPTAVNGAVDDANDENSRNNEVSSKFNAHSHPISDLTGNLDSSQIPATLTGKYLGSSTSTTATQQLITKDPWFDVRAYGAVGDGTSNDTTAVLAAITAANVSGGIIFFPVGTYLLNLDSLAIIKSGITILGAGTAIYDGDAAINNTGTILKFTGTSGVGITINQDGVGGSMVSAKYVPKVLIKDLTMRIDTPAITDTTYGIRGVMWESSVENVTFKGFKYGAYFTQSIIDTIERCNFGDVATDACDIGLYIDSYFHASHVRDCNFDYNRIGLYAKDSGYWWIDGCTVQQSGNAPIWGASGACGISIYTNVGNVSRIWITNSYFEENDNYSIFTDDDDNIAVIPSNVWVKDCYFTDETGTNIYSADGTIYTENNLYGGAATDTGSASGTSIVKYSETNQTYTTVKGTKAIGAGGALSSTSIATGFVGMAVSQVTIAANQSDYLEIDLGGNGNFGVMLYISGFYDTITTGFVQANVSGYLQANALAAGSVVSAVDSGGELGTDLTVNAVTAKGSGNIIRIELKNAHATRAYTCSIMIWGGSGNAAISDWGTTQVVD